MGADAQGTPNEQEVAAPARPLDILYAGTLPPHTGGSAMLCGALLPGLAQRGHRVRAIAPIAGRHASSGDAYAAAHPELAVERILVPFFEDSPDVPQSQAYREHEGNLIDAALNTQIGRARPDVLIAGRETFSWHVPDLALARALPSVLLIQGTTTFGILRGTIPAPMAAHMLAQFHKFDRMVVVARHLAPTLAGLGFDRVAVIENTVDAEQFRPRAKSPLLLRALDVHDGDVVVLHASNLKALKRALDLVTSAGAALARDPRLLYVVAGDGALRGELEAACARQGVRERFRFVGWVPHEQMPDYYSLADLVVMPSAAEARSLVCLEAQACGSVLVASDIPAAREVIEHGTTGLLFATGVCADLTAQTLRAAGDPALRARIGRNARAAALARPLAGMIGAYETLLSDVVRQRRC